MKTTTKTKAIPLRWQSILAIWIGAIIVLVPLHFIDPLYWRYDLYDAIYFTGFGLLLAKVNLLLRS